MTKDEALLAISKADAVFAYVPIIYNPQANKFGARKSIRVTKEDAIKIIEETWLSESDIAGGDVYLVSTFMGDPGAVFIGGPHQAVTA